MTRLMMVIFSIAATTLMGIGIIVVLTLGWVTTNAIILAAAVGFIVAVPVSYFVARALP